MKDATLDIRTPIDLAALIEAMVRRIQTTGDSTVVDWNTGEVYKMASILGIVNSLRAETDTNEAEMIGLLQTELEYVQQLLYHAIAQLQHNAFDELISDDGSWHIDCTELKNYLDATMFEAQPTNKDM